MPLTLRDLTFAVRSLRRRPGSSVLAVLAFGLGIGLCTTMFSIVYGVYFRGIGVPEADRLTVIYRTNPAEGISRMGVDQHDFADWRAQQHAFEGLAGFSTGTVNVSGTEGPERFDGAFVSANLFDILRVRPVVGGAFRPGDDGPGAPLTAVIAYNVWQTRYRGATDIVGRTIKVNGEAATILGVMPEGFHFPEEEDIWIPQRDVRGANPHRGDGPSFSVIGRLRDEVTLDAAALDLAVVTRRLAEAYPESNAGIEAAFTTFVEDSIGSEPMPLFAAMQVATIFVLLIACANVANLLLARATVRTREAAIRAAVGASRFRVAMPFFAEAVVLSGLGAVVGLGLARIGVTLFDRATTGVGRPYFMEFPIDLPVLTFVIAATVLTAVVSGLAPSLQIARTDVNGLLKDESRGTSSGRAGRISRLLVIGQVGLSCALLVGAGLMIKSISNLRNYDYKFDPAQIFTARVGLFENDYPTVETRQRFFRDLEDRLVTLPGVSRAALADALPVSGSNRGRLAIEGQSYVNDQDYPLARFAAIEGDFFQAFGLDVLRGRGFTRQDDGDALPVALVNERFADRFFPGEEPIGRRFRPGASKSEAPWLTIVGVVPNLSMNGLDAQPGDSAGYYVPLAQTDRRFVSLIIRVAGGPPLAVAPQVRRTVASLDPDLPIYWVQDMPQVIHHATWFYHVFGTLFVVFGAAALFLASVGLYGVLTFSVSRRIQEMGIRMALGASSRSVLGLIMREGALQVGIGLVFGLLLAFGVANVVQLVMFNVQGRDPGVFAAIAGVILLVGLLASAVPARRATRVDPMVALRYE